MDKPVKRRVIAITGQNAARRSFHPGSDAIVMLALAPAIRYVDDAGGAIHKRSITGDDDDPNTTAPSLGEYFEDGVGWAELFWHVVLPAGASMDAEVWALTEVDGEEYWILTDTVSAVVGSREYRSPINYRAAFIRATNTVNIGGGSPATLRATPI